jgi:hypothetical protein
MESCDRARLARGVNKVITRAVETVRNETGAMLVENQRFAAGFSVAPKHAERSDRRL